MAQKPAQQAGARPQPNVYTLLLLIAIIALAATIGLAMFKLMSDSGYALSFGELFQGLQSQ